MLLNSPESGFIAAAIAIARGRCHCTKELALVDRFQPRAAGAHQPTLYPSVNPFEAGILSYADAAARVAEYRASFAPHFPFVVVPEAAAASPRPVSLGRIPA